MKTIFLVCLAMFMGTRVLAGGSTGGIGALQLETMAISEKMISAIEMREVTGSSIQLESLRIMRPAARMMESAADQPAGVLLEVKAEDFSEISADAAAGKDFIYRDVPVRVTESNTENETLTMKPIEDPSVTIVVKAAEGSSL